jgi:hypothetical protein
MHQFRAIHVAKTLAFFIDEVAFGATLHSKPPGGSDYAAGDYRNFTVGKCKEFTLDYVAFPVSAD